MKRFQITFADGHTEIIEADGCWPNDWCVAFVIEEARPSRSFSAKPGDTVSKYHSFRVIAGRLVNEVREIAD